MRRFIRGALLLLGRFGNDRLQQTLFLEGADSVGRKGHSNLLAVDHERLLLQVRLEDTLGAAQREAHVVAELFSFTGKFAAGCHFFTP
jgi:hypothetical protein